MEHRVRLVDIIEENYGVGAEAEPKAAPLLHDGLGGTAHRLLSVHAEDVAQATSRLAKDSSRRLLQSDWRRLLRLAYSNEYRTRDRTRDLSGDMAGRKVGAKGPSSTLPQTRQTRRGPAPCSTPC